MEWRKRGRHRDRERPEHEHEGPGDEGPEHEAQETASHRGHVPEGSAKEFTRGQSHVADVTHDRFDGLGKGFAHGEVSEETEAHADHGVPEGSGKQFALGEAQIVPDEDRVGDFSKGFAKGQAHLSGSEDPETGPPD